MFPLPSDDWSNLTDIWFCHQHNHQSESSTGSHDHRDQSDCSPEHVSMLPRSRDCHVGDTYFLVNSGHVIRESVVQTGDGLICSRCWRVVGEVCRNPSRNGKVSLYHGQIGISVWFRGGVNGKVQKMQSLWWITCMLYNRFGKAVLHQTEFELKPMTRWTFSEAIYHLAL